MAAPLVTWIGFALAACAIAVFLLALQLRASPAGLSRERPWVFAVFLLALQLRAPPAELSHEGPWIAWSASDGNGSPGGPQPPPELTIQEIMAYRSEILVWVVMRGVPDRDAEDVVQNVIKGAWESRRRFDPRGGAFSTWLYILTRNHANNYHQRAHIRNETPSADPLERIEAPNDPEAATSMRQQGARAREILDRIPGHLAALFTRYEIEGDPMPEIAAELGIPLTTAWGQLTQARVAVARAVALEDAIEARQRRRRL